MRKILQTLRSRNHDAIYLVIRDSNRHTMEVWQLNPNRAESMDHCRTFPFEPDLNPTIRSRSEAHAARLALNLADALSRMTTSEAIKQFDNLRQFGEVR